MTMKELALKLEPNDQRKRDELERIGNFVFGFIKESILAGEFKDHFLPMLGRFEVLPFRAPKYLDTMVNSATPRDRIEKAINDFKNITDDKGRIAEAISRAEEHLSTTE